MELTVIGSTKKVRAEVEAIAYFVHQKLMPRQRNIEVTIELVRNLSEKEGALGWCMDEGDKEYTVTVDSSLDLPTLLQTVAHEMVHVKQYARGEHAQLARGVFRWKRRYYSLDTDYDKQPWEKEAYKLEGPLFEEFTSL